MKTIFSVFFIVASINIAYSQGNDNSYYKVDKQLDENGNVTRYDSIAITSNVPIDAENIDSVLHAWGMGLSLNSISQTNGVFNDPFFNDFFSTPGSPIVNDSSLHTPNYFGFSNDINEIFRQMEQMRHQILKEMERFYQSPLPETDNKNPKTNKEGKTEKQNYNPNKRVIPPTKTYEI